jgi:hypothetical protein
VIKRSSLLGTFEAEILSVQIWRQIFISGRREFGHIRFRAGQARRFRLVKGRPAFSLDGLAVGRRDVVVAVAVVVVVVKVGAVPGGRREIDK